MKQVLRIIGIVLCCVLLLLIRAFEDRLFYDPLLEFFRIDYKLMPLPEMDNLRLLLNIAYRYFLNSIVSLGLLWLVFFDSGIIKFSAVLYVLLFFVLIGGFIFFIFSGSGSDNLLLLFYIRRFLIQPIFVLILLPAFYFQMKKSR